MKKRGSTLTKPKRRSAPKVARRRKLSAADANEKIALLTRELSESLEQQTATSDILRAIAAAPGDADGTLRKIAETTARLFGAVGVSFRVAEGDEFKLSVGVGQGAEQIGTKLFDDPTKRPKVHGRNLPGSVVRENRQINIPDLDHLDHEQAEWPGLAVARSAGIRTLVGTPLRTEGRAIGALMVYRNVLQPFDLAELQLQQSFADQAVIAIENARLINETREALEQQKASGEVLSVISGSVADASPVFDRILDGCERLVAFERAAIFLVDAEEQVQLATARGQSGESVNSGPARNVPATVGSHAHAPGFQRGASRDLHRRGERPRRALDIAHRGDQDGWLFGGGGAYAVGRPWHWRHSSVTCRTRNLH